MERTDFEQWKSKEVARLLALVEAERRYYQEMIAALPTPVVVLAADLALVYANRAFRQLFGLRTEELRRKTILQIVSSDRLEAKIREAHAEGRPQDAEEFATAARTFRIAIVPMRNWDDESELETLLVIEAAQPAAALVEPPEEVVDEVVDEVVEEPTPEPEPIAEPVPAIPAELPAVIWTADAATLAFQTVAGAAEATLGYPAGYWIETPGFFEERIYSEDREAAMDLYRATLETGGEATAEYRALTISGGIIWCRESIYVPPPGDDYRVVTGVLTDITRRKELERQMLTAARMEALQGLTGRLAHELNNPLMIASGYGEELLQTLDEDNPVRSDVAEILGATKRLGFLADRLNEFGRRQGNPVQSVPLTSLIGGIGSQIRRIANVDVTFHPSDEPLWALADHAQLEQILVALAAGSGAQRTSVTIAWNTDMIVERTAGAALAPGEYVRIAVTDDGTGLDEVRQAAIFETVLPEKDPAATGGLLNRGYALVREWGGDLALSRVEPRGTEFVLYLRRAEPVAEPEPEPVAETPAVTPVVIKPEPQRETVLVVDDEAGIRSLVRKILRRERYQVLEAASAEEALTIAVSHGGPIHLLVTDVMLPGLNGPELAKRMYEASPSLRVLYISGYTEDESVRAGGYPPGARFLPKPFTLSALVTAVRDTLDAE